jgi:hypothetical protein
MENEIKSEHKVLSKTVVIGGIGFELLHEKKNDKSSRSNKLVISVYRT